MSEIRRARRGAKENDALVVSYALPSLLRRPLPLLSPSFSADGPVVCHSYGDRRADTPSPRHQERKFLHLLFAVLLVCAVPMAKTAAQQPAPPAVRAPKQQWKTVPFAIVRYNDDAPKSWNVYHAEKKGAYLVRLWKRYLLIDTTLQSAYEIDPAKVKVEGDNAELSPTDIPTDPIDTTEWKSRDAGPVLRHRFRFGTSGNFMELQIPLQLNGKPAY